MSERRLKVRKDQVYAVVDIESTGGSIGKGERMIQFACVLVKNGKVIEEFETLVNPLKKVPKRIQSLTGIHPKELSRAPLFEELAEFIHDLLSETIFVAHNVSFDFRFLNEEFARVGLSPLSIPAIDTVELSQILFPKADSYNLQELVEELGYELDQPHHALFDAEATAFLLQKLDKRVKDLPLVTLEKLVHFAPYCTAQTVYFFEDALKSAKESPKNLPEDLVVVHGIALKHPFIDKNPTSYREEKIYPDSTQGKKDMFEGYLTKRKGQEEMMDTVYHYLTTENPEKELAIEAGAGSGKSLGYLLPACFSSSLKKPIVISTYTTVLQNQLIEETIPVLKKVLPFEISVALVKSRRHYLSLTAFEHKLIHTTPSELEALFCMRVLVWLTETHTGDLEEMGAGGHDNHDFWEEIRAARHTAIMKQDKWEEYEFYNRSLEKIKEAELLITNHAFLSQDWKKEEATLPSFEQLIIDEAHHWPEVVQNASTVSVSNYQITQLVKKIGDQSSSNTLLYNCAKLIEKKVVKQYQLDSLQANIQLFAEEWESFIHNWLDQIEATETPHILEWKEKILPIDQQTLTQKKQTKHLVFLLNELLFIGNRIVELSTKEIENFSISERLIIEDLYQICTQLETCKQAIEGIFTIKETASLSWSSYYTKEPSKSVHFHGTSMKVNQQLHEHVHKLSHVIYTSSTLSVHNDLRYFQEQVYYSNIEFLTVKDPYNYPEQVRVYSPTDGFKTGQLSEHAYIKQLAEDIEDLLKGVEENTLILFRSIDILQAVYRELNKYPTLEGRPIFAQHLSGTRAKLLKQFRKTTNGILLGADSFWEGVDLPEEALKIVVVTRLPFDSPDMPLVKLRHQSLEKRGENPFVMDLLPKAVLRLKQGFGRLIRSEKDKGVCIILDDRFFTASYGKVFQQALPSEVPIRQLNKENIREEIQSFLNNEE